MSTSLLYHGFGIRGYVHRSTEYSHGQVCFRLHQPREALRCSVCGTKDVTLHGYAERIFKSVPIGGKPVKIVLPIPRVECSNCKVTRQVKIGFADWRRSYTRSFERYALELSQHMTIKDVAEHLTVSWDVIKDIQKRDLGRRFARPKLKHLRQIAIDEISIGKGHRYLTVVLDLESGVVVHVGDSKGKDALKPFLEPFAKIASKSRSCGHGYGHLPISMQSPVISQTPLSSFDRFHVIKLFNDKLSDLRRDLYREAKNQLHKNVLKGTRWFAVDESRKSEL